MSTFPEALVHNNLFRRRASVTLDIVIVGGGLSGLSTAYNLRQAGHNVRVLEKLEGPPKVSSFAIVRCLLVSCMGYSSTLAFAYRQTCRNYSNTGALVRS